MEEKYKEKKWDNKDWGWLCIILFLFIIIMVLIIIAMLSIRLSDNTEIVNIVSLGTGITSIILAMVAIGLSLKQEYSANITNLNTRNLLESMRLDLNNIDNKFNNYNTEEMKKSNILLKELKNIVDNKKLEPKEKEVLQEAYNELEKNKYNYIKDEIKNYNIENINALLLLMNRKLSISEISKQMGYSMAHICRLNKKVLELEEAGISKEEIEKYLKNNLF